MKRSIKSLKCNVNYGVYVSGDVNEERDRSRDEIKKLRQKDIDNRWIYVRSMYYGC